METLPTEMLELIVRQLTPRDLAHCSAVCRSWHEKLNQNWIWKPHCDPELEEPLRTIPSIVTSFKIPEANTLSEICHWKLAFLRERHLWENWRLAETMEFRQENIIKSGNKNPLSVDFLTESLLVVLYSNCIEVLDVSDPPAVSVAKTNQTVEIQPCDKLSVIGTCMLLVEKEKSVEIFNVDIPKKSIKMKHNFFFNIQSDLPHSRVLNEKFQLLVFNDGPKLKILDVNTGEIIKEEPYPMKTNQIESNVNRHEVYQVYRCINADDEYYEIFHTCNHTTVNQEYITSSPTSDFIAVASQSIQVKDHCSLYIYSLKKFTFLSGPEIELKNRFSVALHGHWMAVLSYKLDIFYFSQKGEVVLSNEISNLTYIYGPTINVCNDSFVFMDFNYYEKKSRLRVYFPASKTLSTVGEDFMTQKNEFTVVNNKFIAVFDYLNMTSVPVFKPVNGEVESFNFSVVRNSYPNCSFTKVVNRVSFMATRHPERWYISYLW